MEKELRILILEDVPTNVKLMEHELRKRGIIFTSRHVDKKESFLKELLDFMPDLILADYSIPNFDGISALEIVKEQCPDVPFILVSGAIGEESAIEILKKGATDYIFKDRLSRLVPSVKRALHEAEERKERKQMERALQEERKFSDLAIDSLPGIFCLSDEDGCMLRWNKNSEIITGYSAEEISNMTLLDFIAEEDKKLAKERIQEVFIKGSASVEAALVSKDGIRVPYLFKGVCFISDNKNYLVGMGLDITERKRAEETLHKSKEQLQKRVNELEEFYKSAVGRELRMKGLKEEIESLKEELEKYKKQ